MAKSKPTGKGSTAAAAAAPAAEAKRKTLAHPKTETEAVDDSDHSDHHSNSDEHSENDNESDAENVEQTSKGTKPSNKNKSKKHSSSRSLKHNKSSSLDATVLYIGHLPHLFGETELLQFLQQFGGVARLKVSRNPKTLHSRGFAFVQLKDAATAAIVADTLSGYLLFDRKQHVRKRLVCHVVPRDKVHPRLFVTPKRRQHQNAKADDKPTTSAMAIQTITARLVARERQKRLKLKAAGMDYDFPGYAAGAEHATATTTATAATTSRDGHEDPKKKQKPDTDGAPTSELLTKKQRKDSIGENSHASKVPSPDNKSADRESHTKKKRKESVESATSVGSSHKKSKKDERGSADKSVDASVDRNKTFSSSKDTPLANEKKKKRVQPVSSDKLADGSANKKELKRVGRKSVEEASSQKKKDRSVSLTKTPRKDSSSLSVDSNKKVTISATKVGSPGVLTSDHKSARQDSVASADGAGSSSKRKVSQNDAVAPLAEAKTANSGEKQTAKKESVDAKVTDSQSGSKIEASVRATQSEKKKKKKQKKNDKSRRQSA